jgi:signal transduction histidine kinase
LCDDYRDVLGAEARQQLDLLRSRVARVHNLIDGVLQCSRVGRVREDVVHVHLNALIPEIVDGIAPPEHVDITVEGPLPTIGCEKTRITQVFQNLLSNAVKYMDKPRGRVRISCTQEEDFWKFSVADNGPGIEERHFDRIFRMFQSLAPRDDTESTGVGLTLVKKIAEMYRGKVWAESEVGRGSTFYFSWPKQPRQLADR